MADTAYQRTKRTHVSRIWEQVYPVALGLLVGVAWIVFGCEIVRFAAVQGWHFDQLYTAVFAFLAVTTGFLATFYGTLLCVREGFIERIRHTRTFDGFLKMTKRAIISGFIVAISSVPMMVITPLPMERYSLLNILVAAWLCAAVWAIASFYRVASLFFFLFETKVETGHPAH